MSYATTTKIQNEFKNLDLTNGIVNTALVTQFLADADAEINSRLSVKYQTPITGTEALTVISMLEIWLVKHRILQLLKVKTGKNSEDQDGSVNYRDEAIKIMDKLVAGTMKLTDATYATAADGVRSYSNDNPSSAPLVFDRTTAQW